MSDEIVPIALIMLLVAVLSFSSGYRAAEQRACLTTQSCQGPQ